MDHHEQRRLGVEIATQAGAPKARDAITRGDCFDAIFKEAGNEIGRDALVSGILEGDPEWAQNALLHVPGLSDAHRDALLERAAGTPESALRTLRLIEDLGGHRDALLEEAGALGGTLGSISQLSLTNIGGFMCQFTMYWMDGGTTQPAGTSGASVIWSREMFSSAYPVVMKCSEFAASTAPLHAGDEVWMHVWVSGGKANESLLRFIYDPNSGATANFFISGTTGSNQLESRGITVSQVPAPSAGLGSNSNYILYDNCTDLVGLSVTIQVTESIVCKSASGPTTGFSFQLNCYSPKNELSAWQQYVVAVFGSEIYGGVNNWSLTGQNPLVSSSFKLASTPNNNELPKGYRVTLSLQSDADNNITGATYVIVDDKGNTLANVPLVLESIEGVTKADLAPIVAFELNIVGPDNGESAVLSSGAGTITYSATSLLTAVNSGPSCAESDYTTEETANSVYGTLPEGASPIYVQRFLTNHTGTMIHKPGLIRPSTRR